MGALPKIRVSKTRQARKRAHYLRLKMPHIRACSQCGTLGISHTVCKSCGTYKGNQVLEIEDSVTSS